MPDSDVKDDKSPKIGTKKSKFTEMTNGHSLAKKLKSAGYDVNQPTEQEGMICYPQEKNAEVTAKLETCPPDPRFQQQNVTKWCYRMYIDYKRCAHLLGEDSEYCDYFYKCYHSLCPNEWHTKWDEQIEKGTFPRDVTIDMQPLGRKQCEHQPPTPRPTPQESSED